MSKMIAFDNAAFESIRQGVTTLAALLLTSDVLIVDKPEKEEPKVPAGMGMY